MTKPRKATASNPTVKTQLAKLTQEVKELRASHGEDSKTIRGLKRQLTEANTVIAGDLKTDLVQRIKSKSNYGDADLENLEVEQLQQIDSTLSMSKTPTSTTFKPIHAGGDTANSNTTVGGLYGKTREEILAMGGEH